MVADATDRAILEQLINDGRLANAELARRVGIPESTCSVRVRLLKQRGILRGVHADVDLAPLGRPIHAMVAVRFAGHQRAAIDAFRRDVVDIPGVLAAFHMAGENDFLIHICAKSPEDLRDFVLDHLTTRPGIAQAHTSLIFERFAGKAVLR